jgi:hypothetical protein
MLAFMPQGIAAMTDRPIIVAAPTVEPRAKRRKVRRRTFAQIRKEQRREDAAFLQAHATKLKATGQVDEACAVQAAAGMISAGLAELEGKR